VEYELPREGPTQTGIAYPKYYIWVKCFKGQKVASEGAVRLAAIEQKGFEITDFVSCEQIRASQSVVLIFPPDVAEKVLGKVRQ